MVLKESSTVLRPSAERIQKRAAEWWILSIRLVDYIPQEK